MGEGKRLAACGLNCEECDQYKLPTDEAVQNKLLPWYRKQSWIGANDGIDVVIEKKMYCKGCGDPDVCWSSNCTMMKCCKQDRKLENCAECADFPCEKIQKHKSSNDRYREAVEYLEAQRQKRT